MSLKLEISKYLHIILIDNNIENSSITLIAWTIIIINKFTINNSSPSNFGKKTPR